MGAATATLAEGLLARLDGDATGASTLLLRAEEELDALGRRYEAACVALEAAASLEAMGEHERAAHARARAVGVLDPLGCVNPY
jgi:mannose/cellobiose epimerase-like protein (N-acyl-D-glucosamine 2-epimerase family)